MRHFKLCVLILVFALFAVRFAQATEVGDHFRTSLGIKFEAVKDDAFGVAWKSPDGKIWSNAIGFLKFKDALAECRKLNAHVPSLEEYKVLRNNFEMRAGSNNALSERGLGELQALFPDLKSYSYFWTSTLVPGDSGIAFILDGVYGTLGSGVMETYIEVYTQCLK